jgi:hypothetical protein
LLRIPFCLAGEEVSCGDQGEWIGVFEQGFDLAGVVEDLDGGKTDADLAAEELVAEGVRFPAFALSSASTARLATGLR